MSEMLDERCPDCDVAGFIINGRPCDHYWSGTGICENCGHGADCHSRIAKELRRLRAAVEAVPRFDLDEGHKSHCPDGAYMDADDVLAALEVNDGD